MKVLAVCVLALAAAALVVANEHASWVEPAYADADAAEEQEAASLLESGAKGRLRGISHTVSGHHGMVTYISPARRIQTSGIVLTPPPTVTTQFVSPPAPLYQPVYQPLYAVPAHHHLPHLTADDIRVEHVHAHHHHRHNHIHPEALDETDVHEAVIAHDGGRHHVHSVHVPRGVAGRVHIGSGVHAGDVHVHPYAPVAVPASLYALPYHQPHYGHDSPVSQGAILVPHGPEGGLALEEPEYTGYNPGPAVQYHSIPTAYYSDGTPHPAHITQRYN